jgi:hypothetical protein
MTGNIIAGQSIKNRIKAPVFEETHHRNSKKQAKLTKETNQTQRQWDNSMAFPTVNLDVTRMAKKRQVA